MDDSRFDRLARVFGAPRSRRGALAVLAGVAAVGVGEADARLVHGKRFRSAGEDKTAICHYDKDSNTYDRIVVANSSLKAHGKHGDFRSGDCCETSQCADGQVCSYSKGNFEKASACICDAAACGKLGGSCDENGTCVLGAAACYWMTPDGSEWLPSPNPAPTQDACQKLDSCAEGGGGGSGGGCYRWQLASGTIIAPCGNDWADTSCTN